MATKKQEHTGFRNGELFCFNCGGSFKINFPESINVVNQQMNFFSELHKNCEKTWNEPIPNPDEKTIEENKNWWLKHGEHGMSSEAMFAVLSMNEGDRKLKGNLSHPCDPDDFKRCSQLLQAVPQWKTELYKLKPISKTWSNLVDNWENWIDDCKAQTGCFHIELKSGQFVANVV